MEILRIIGLLSIAFGALTLVVTLIFINIKMRKISQLDNETSDYLFILIKRDKLTELILFSLILVGASSRINETINIIYLIALFGVGLSAILKAIHNLILNMLLFNPDNATFLILTEFIVNLDFRKGFKLLKETFLE